MRKKKKAALKARGIRFSEEAWKKLTDEADEKSSTPSDIVRGIVDDYCAESDGVENNVKET